MLKIVTGTCGSRSSFKSERFLTRLFKRKGMRLWKWWGRSRGQNFLNLFRQWLEKLVIVNVPHLSKRSYITPPYPSLQAFLCPPPPQCVNQDRETPFQNLTKTPAGIYLLKVLPAGTRAKHFHWENEIHTQARPLKHTLSHWQTCQTSEKKFLKCVFSWGDTCVCAAIVFPVCHAIGKTTGPLKHILLKQN